MIQAFTINEQGDGVCECETLTNHSLELIVIHSSHTKLMLNKLKAQ